MAKISKRTKKRRALKKRMERRAAKTRANIVACRLMGHVFKSDWEFKCQRCGIYRHLTVTWDGMAQKVQYSYGDTIKGIWNAYIGEQVNGEDEDDPLFV